MWVALQPTQAMLKDRGYNFLNVVGELNPGVSIAQAQQELNAIAAHIPLEKSESPMSFRATPYQEVLTGPVGRSCTRSLQLSDAGVADRVRECFQSADQPLHRSPAGICRAKSTRSQSHAAGPANVDRRIGSEPAGLRYRFTPREDGYACDPQATGAAPRSLFR